MLRFLRRHRVVVLVALAACIIGLALFDAGRGMLMKSPQDAVATLNGHKITESQFNRVYDQLLRQKPDASGQDRQKTTNMAFQELVREEVFAQEADKYGIVVTDQELQAQIARAQAFQTNGQFDPQRYLEVVTQVFHMTPSEFEKMQRKDIAARKLHFLIASAVFIPDSVVAKAAAAEPKKPADMDAFARSLREKEASLVLQDWLTQLNMQLASSLKLSDTFQQRLQGHAE